ncbi:MAG: glutathione S-transferase family protein [Janthinobacterium lividum]
MSQVILHQYGSSPFSEKVRLALGIKGLSWRAVDIAPAPPRPLLTPLTGGYRRTPVLQIGADIFCDTNIILPTLERLYPTPSLYPVPFGALSKALSFNWERAIWIAAVGVLVHFVDDMPPDFIRDRKEGYLYVDISKGAMEPKFDLNVQHVRAQLTWLKDSLADGRRFLLGDAPSALDLGYYHPILLMRRRSPAEVDDLLGLAPILPWYHGVAGLGHGTPSALEAEAALAIAKAVMPAPVSHIARDLAPSGLRQGMPVSVTPDDTAKVSVTGTLVAIDDLEIIIHRDDPQAGDLHLHFPRAGFEVREA